MNKEQRSKYNAGYKKRIRPTTTEMFSDGRYTFSDLKVAPTMDNFTGTGEPTYCSTFGCRKELTLPEQLAGTKCTGCMGTKETIFKHYKL